MYDSYIVKRTQIYLDDDQSRELAQRAAARGTTASKVIREAIDQYLAEPDDDDIRLRRYRSALEASFATSPQLRDGASYVDDLRAADRERDRERDRELDERRRG
jgi:hypothetical protein